MANGAGEPATRAPARRLARPGAEDRLFRVVIALKGLDGLLEVLGGILLLFLEPEQLAGIGRFLTQHELSEDPHDVVANLVLHGASSLSAGHATLFGAFYLLSHGLVKVVLVWAVLRDRLWAYPWMIAFLGIFIVYQAYRIVVRITLGMVLLTLFDLVVVWLTVREYRRNRERVREGLPVRS
jgi:uncharacterized membrane protein